MTLQESGVTHRQLLSVSFSCPHSYYTANKYTFHHMLHEKQGSLDRHTLLQDPLIYGLNSV